MKKIIVLALMMLAVVAGNAASKKNVKNSPLLPYKNAALTPEQRTEDLLSRMTLEEKVMQMGCSWFSKSMLFLDDKGAFDKEKASKMLKNGIGQIARITEDKSKGAYNMQIMLHPREAAKLYNQVQHFLVEETRLGIPVLVHEEGLHGQQTQDATSFPSALGMSCSWDEQLMHDVYTIVAKEIRIKGAGEVLAPVVDVVRDPRWGRTDETMGEDPYLISRLSQAQVKAYQGGDGLTFDQEHVGATLKHFGIHGYSEGGNNIAPSHVERHEAYNIYFKSFRDIIRECNPANVMINYNEVWGLPGHGNKDLIRNTLRRDFGFKGLVVSDYSGISDLCSTHKMAATNDEAGVLGLEAGMQVELPELQCWRNLPQMVNDGKIPESLIDECVRAILLEKFRLGLFEHPYADPEAAEKYVGCEANRKVAYKAATESMVLLKNDTIQTPNTQYLTPILPLDASKLQGKTIALIGPNADRCVLGGYSNIPRDTITPLRAIREKYGKQMNIEYSLGCKLIDAKMVSAGDAHGGYKFEMLHMVTEQENADRIAAAVETAKKADIVLLFIGGNEFTNREGTSPVTGGDLPTLELQSGQVKLIEQLKALGKPIVAVINSGTTLNIQPALDNCDAVIQGWFLGQETGYAVIDAIFGDVTPTGKLSISMPRGAGYVPCYYNYQPSSHRGYSMDIKNGPIFPFGYGLSYTTYSYSNLRMMDSTGSPTSEMPKYGSVDVSVDVTNTGSRAGSEIVQMYITDDVASMPRPVKELKGFRRVDLNPGETKTVTMKITADELSFYNYDMQYVVEPGTFTIQVGPSSDKGDKLTLMVK